MRFIHPLRRTALALAAITALAATFVTLIIITNGTWAGIPAWLITTAIGTTTAIWRIRRRTRPRRLTPLIPVAIAMTLTATVLIPTTPTERHIPGDPPATATQHWKLATGSNVAVYHYEPDPDATPRSTPLVFLHGGPVRSISLIDHKFLRLLAEHGYDVYAYEQAGGGRSELLPMEQYGIDRSVRDLAAFIRYLDAGPVDILGFSAGGTVLTRTLATPEHAALVRKAIVAEPGPMDGPTASIDGHPGRPNARDLAPAVTGPRSTNIPRYAVAFGLMRLGLLSPDSELIGQAEGVNAFTAADLGGDTASAYCAKDADRIPVEDSTENFSFSAAASMRVQETIKDSPSIAQGLGQSTVPTMLMIAECSSQIRQWATAVLDTSPAVERTQYMPDVGHHMWNGLDDNDERAFAAVDAFLQGTQAPLPNYPTDADIPTFLDNDD